MRLFLAACAALALAACGPSASSIPLNAALTDGPPGADHVIGGSIDATRFDAARGVLEVTGWHMFTPRTAEQVLQVYAPGAEGVLTVTRTDRPDVSQAVGDDDLRSAGFVLELSVPAGATVSELCITMDDKHYGKRVLNAHTADQIRCPSAGQ